MTQPRESDMTPIGPGIYDDGRGQLHVHINELVIASGGDLRNRADVEKAIAIVRQFAGDLEIPIETRVR